MEIQYTDRISNIPVDLIEHILEGLPLADRVKTSVLSTKWRFLWTQLPFLVFDWNFHRLICQTKGKPLSDYTRIINSIVLQLPRNVREVSLYIPGEEGELESNDVNLFHHLIKRLLCNGLERLHVDGQGTWPISRSIFSPAVMSFAIRLTHLYLFGCEFSPPSSLSPVFPSLISANLETLETSAPEISCFLSSCPKLQKIKLRVDFPQQYLDIKALELRHLEVHGNFKWLRLSSADNIEVLIIDMLTLPDSWSDMGRDISDLFGGMAKLEKINFETQFYKIMAAHSHILNLNLPIYDGLKILDFYWIELYDKAQVQYIWNFITRCTNLTNLSLIGLDCANATLNEIFNEMECNHSFKHLINLKFYIHNCDNNVVLKMIEVLFGHSPALEWLSIQFNPHLDDQVVSKAIKEIMKFRRASTKAKVVYITDRLYFVIGL